MSDTIPIESFNGTYPEVSAFFRRDRRTVERWVSSGAIGHWKFGEGDVTFGEQHIVKFWVKHSREAEGLKPGEAEKIALEKWRAHLALARADQIRPLIEDLRQRVADLEKCNQGVLAA